MVIAALAQPSRLLLMSAVKTRLAMGADSADKASFTSRKARMVQALVGSGEAELRRFFDGQA